MVLYHEQHPANNLEEPLLKASAPPGRFVRFARNNFAVILLFFRLFDAAPRGISDVMLVLVA